jgi:pimeloyl-ACP methyl ester carboxylesterase
VRLGGRLPPAEMFPAGRAGYETRFLTLPGGLRVRAVLCEPDAAAPDAPTAVFVHGWACSLFTWHRNLRPVADAGVRVATFDLKGHGLSDKPLDMAEYTLPAMTRHLLDVLDALGIERALLVGHSMGCAMALRVAMEAPGRVARLVLAAPVGFGAIGVMRVVPWVTPPPIEQILPWLMFRWTFRIGLWRAYGHVGRPAPGDLDEYWAPTQDPAFIKVLCRLARAFDWTDGDPEELSRVRCPTTVLFGGRDHLVRPSACARYVDHIPDVEMETVPGAGHTLPEEVPDVVNGAVLRAASRLASGPRRAVAERAPDRREQVAAGRRAAGRTPT